MIRFFIFESYSEHVCHMSLIRFNFWKYFQNVSTRLSFNSFPMIPLKIKLFKSCQFQLSEIFRLVRDITDKFISDMLYSKYFKKIRNSWNSYYIYIYIYIINIWHMSNEINHKTSQNYHFIKHWWWIDPYHTDDSHPVISYPSLVIFDTIFFWKSCLWKNRVSLYTRRYFYELDNLKSFTFSTIESINMISFIRYHYMISTDK